MKFMRYALLGAMGLALSGCALFESESRNDPNSFQVFFDFDRATLSETAAQTIQDAADAAKRGNVSSISLTVYTDAISSGPHSQTLSERRADIITAELIKDGVPAGKIARISIGDAPRLTPTADGTSEPQNRRTEIILR